VSQAIHVAAALGISDLNMLVGPGGQKRNVQGYRALLAAADLTLTAVIDTGSSVFVLEAQPCVPQQSSSK
jgi:hypothetical protein